MAFNFKKYKSAVTGTPFNKNGDEPKLTMSDLGNLATKGAKAIQAGIKIFQTVN